MINISHLVVNGCSFTYGQGLENREESNWPALLSKKLGVPVINLANMGAGCDRIFRTTHEYFIKDVGNNNNPFYIIAFSGALRREEWQVEFNDFYNVNLCDPVNNLSRALIDNMDEKGLLSYERKKYVFWSSVISLFKAYNIPYLTTDYMPTTTYDDGVIRSLLPETYDYCINDPNKLEDFNKLTNDFSKLPCGHDDYPAQEFLANYCYSKIIKKYKAVYVTNNVYTKQI